MVTLRYGQRAMPKRKKASLAGKLRERTSFTSSPTRNFTSETQMITCHTYVTIPLVSILHIWSMKRQATIIVGKAAQVQSIALTTVV
ncbi:zinc-binding loop region of homing endonuclease domain-containing protein [Colletotrichum scovillei]|uniref:Zinc-binding loop region of homing endonuclease domain-containing protein n=1 Tax=Colletotrichum scovillei TaxID=1209932 RepID=A0A9P7UBF1_9PEZI|nr:zinc-binding loop region of homing endonuclease domain-containing protein [Colletotrichum scovillei]KAG7052188.1 zinc-binding loop region of homing endonuclease domain-containing protein [Colletotrichum scovillei]KAG7064477.1 zinc-binding loop region of homing endonuclease domain-containing protein [Colletotrichum scovillei]